MQNPFPQSRRLSGLHLFLFLGILLSGIYLRFSRLDRQSLWDDEMSTVKDLTLPFSAWPDRFRTYEMHPPFYFLQLREWEKVLGQDWNTSTTPRALTLLRANSAFWGSLSLVLIFLLMRGYGGPIAGLIAMALMAFSPYHLAYSQELRPYAMAMTLGVWGLWVLESCLSDRKSRLGWVVLCLVWTAELYTHYWGSFVVLAQWLYGFSVSDSKLRNRLISVGAVAAALFGCWLPILFTQLHVIQVMSFWVPAPSLWNVAKISTAFCGLYFPVASAVFRMPGSNWMLGIVGLAYGIIFMEGLWKGPRGAWVWLFAGIGIPFIVSGWKPGSFVWYRYPCLMFPAFIVLLAAGIRALPSRISQAIFLGVLLLSEGVGCWIYFTVWQKANPKVVVTYVDQLETPGAVVIRPVYFSPLYSYYDQGTAPVIDEHRLDSAEKRAQLKNKRILFVAFDVPSDPIGEALLSEFHLQSARHFTGFGHLGITVYELRGLTR